MYAATELEEMLLKVMFEERLGGDSLLSGERDKEAGMDVLRKGRPAAPQNPRGVIQNKWVKGWRQGFSQWDDGSQLAVWPLRVSELS